MMQSMWNKRFPTLIGLLLIGLSTFATVYVTNSPQLLTLIAGSPPAVEDIKVSNQSGTSLSISFTTEESVASQIRFGETLTSAATFFDDRDRLEESIGSYKTHHFTIENLRPGARYVFAILLQSTTLDNNGAGFIVKTANVDAVSNKDSTEALRGTILDSSRQAVTDAIVFVTIDAVSPLSSVVSTQGDFFVPLSNLVTVDTTGSYRLGGDEILTIEVVSAEGPGAVVKVPVGQHSDIGTIVLGENRDLTAVKAPSASGFDTEPLAQPVDTENREAIMNPRDGDLLIDPKPHIEGSGKPGQRIEVIVESEPHSAALVVDDNGHWSYQPDESLPPGKHTATVKFFDGDTLVRTLQSKFEVLASGTQVSQPATASAQVSPTPLVPTSAPSPSIAPTVGPIPQTGTPMPGILLFAAGMFLAVTGALAFRFW